MSSLHGFLREIHSRIVFWRGLVMAWAHYPLHVWRIRRKIRRGEKVRIGFLVASVTKWKVQSLYTALQKSGRYEPVVVLTLSDIIADYDREARQKYLEEARAFFAERGIVPLLGFKVETGANFSLERFALDVVFYQTPWSIPCEQDPGCMAKFMLTCHIPYYVPNYGDLFQECLTPLHKSVNIFMVLNGDLITRFRRAYSPWHYPVHLVDVGHPMLDIIQPSAGDESGWVIYAPHWSVKGLKENRENYSTFLKNGRLILDYAKAHSELNWLFKPHPGLPRSLRELGWTEAAIDSYYQEWEKIGKVCYSGGYEDIFNQSRALITDCGSFTVEYAATGMPLVHLISSDCLLKPLPGIDRLFGAYYQAHNWTEFEQFMDRVVLRRDDYKREERITAARSLGLFGSNSARRIVAYFDKIFGVKVDDDS